MTDTGSIPGMSDRRQFLADVRRARRETNTGHYITYEAMRVWLFSLGSGKEVPTPTCVCGEDHAVTDIS